MKYLIYFAAVLGVASPALAHDMWVSSPTFRVAEGQPTAVNLRVGHAHEVDPWNAPWERVHSFRSYGPTGVEDQQAALVVPPPTGQPNANFVLKGKGTHIVALESYHSTSTLAADKFTAYLDTEGLDNAKSLRAQTGMSGQPGVELYSRRAKALIQVGSTPSDNVLRPIGQTLEIVPLINPYARGTSTALPVRVLFQGRPLANAQVRIQPLYIKDGAVQKIRSDAEGRATFVVPNNGAWLIMVVHARPMTTHPTAAFDTIFASMTFGFSNSSRP